MVAKKRYVAGLVESLILQLTMGQSPGEVEVRLEANYSLLLSHVVTRIGMPLSADPCRGGAQKLRSCMLTAQHYAAVAVFADSYRPSVASPFLL